MSCGQAALELFGDDPAVPFDAIAAELASEARLLRVLVDERERHEIAREAAYQRVDSMRLARSLPGISSEHRSWSLLWADRDDSRTQQRSKHSPGVAPRSSGTGDIALKGQPTSKAGSSSLRAQLVMSAQPARRVDPQLAAIHHRQIVKRGAHHTKALCVVAARLAERALLVQRAEPYVIRDIDGRPEPPRLARQLEPTP